MKNGQPTKQAERPVGTGNGISEQAYARRASLACEVLLQGRWRIQILCAMRSGPVRLGQLARLIPNASRKMLIQNLRRLEADGVVIRRDLSDLVLHVEYDLETRLRDFICPLLDELSKWGGFYLQQSVEGHHSTEDGNGESVGGIPSGLIRATVRN
jgi:DNA-binding HxlR family transcriptional regulator